MKSIISIAVITLIIGKGKVQSVNIVGIAKKITVKRSSGSPKTISKVKGMKILTTQIILVSTETIVVIYPFLSLPIYYWIGFHSTQAIRLRIGKSC